MENVYKWYQNIVDNFIKLKTTDICIKIPPSYYLMHLMSPTWLYRNTYVPCVSDDVLLASDFENGVLVFSLNNNTRICRFII